MSDPIKNEATYFKEEVEATIKRYGKMSVYATIGALEVVKQNLLERLGRMGFSEDEQVFPEVGESWKYSDDE
jgi:hypothetical protein